MDGKLVALSDCLPRMPKKPSTWLLVLRRQKRAWSVEDAVTRAAPWLSGLVEQGVEEPVHLVLDRGQLRNRLPANQCHVNLQGVEELDVDAVPGANSRSSRLGVCRRRWVLTCR